MTKCVRTPEETERLIGHLQRMPKEKLVDLVEFAWGIIANAGYGDWTKESQDWQWAADKWGREAGFRQ